MRVTSEDQHPKESIHGCDVPPPVTSATFPWRQSGLNGEPYLELDTIFLSFMHACTAGGLRMTAAGRSS